MSETKEIAKVDKTTQMTTYEVIDHATLLAETIAKSKVFNQFTDKEDIIACILLGHEIGLKPMESLSFGKRLTVDKVHGVLKGKTLGVDTVTSIEHIHQIKTGNGVVSTVGVHLIVALLLKAGIKINFIEDFIPLYQYIDMSGNTYQQETIESSKDRFQVISESTPDSDYDKMKIQVVFTTKEYTRRTIVEMTRGVNVIRISYTLQQATDAGLYHGVSTQGKDVTGKGNWNDNAASMLRNRPLSICGRIIGADVINGLYTFEEIIDLDKTIVLDEEEGITVLKDSEGKVIARDQPATVETAEVLDTEVEQE